MNRSKEVVSHGLAHAGEGREAEHQERAEGGAEEADDLAPPEVGPAGPRTPGRSGQAPRWVTWPRPRGPHAGAALRAGEEGRHPRSVPDGEVGPDQGTSKIPLG